MSDGSASKELESPTGDRAAARRREILEAAERVFGRAGYWNATTADIAKEVGITQPALYRYFPSKRDLFLQALTLRQAEIESVVLDAVRGPGSARDRISRVAAATRALAHAHPEMAMLRIQAVALAGVDEEVRAGIRDTLSQLFDAHEALLTQAKADGSVDASIDAKGLSGAIAGLAFMLYAAITVDHPRAAPEATDRSIESLLDALAPRPAGGSGSHE